MYQVKTQNIDITIPYNQYTTKGIDKYLKLNLFLPFSHFSGTKLICIKIFLSGKKETKSGVDCLRETIKNSPDPWKVLKTLRPETRAKLIDFVDNGEFKFLLSYLVKFKFLM